MNTKQEPTLNNRANPTGTTGGPGSAPEGGQQVGGGVINTAPGPGGAEQDSKAKTPE